MPRSFKLFATPAGPHTIVTSFTNPGDGHHMRL